MKNKNELAAALGLPPLPSCSAETIGALLWAREVLQNHQTTTYAVQDPKGIEDLKSIKIGGVEQWLHIRGRNRDNPILLYLHGGPGYPLIGWMEATMQPWEDYFTVVHWDQRQTGKSYYSANDETDPLTVNQFISDTEEVIQYLLGFLDQSKLFLLGHSWGSMLGMQMVERHPDWLYAYIGIGQIVSWMDNEKVLFDRLIDHAKNKQETELVAKLNTISPYPNPEKPGESFAKHSNFLRIELSRLARETGTHHLPLNEAIAKNALSRLLNPFLTVSDLVNGIFGDQPACYLPPYHFADELMQMNLPDQIGSSFDVPIFFFSGRHDYQTPVTLSDAWFEKIKAPYKELVHFEESAHIVVREEPGKVLVNLVNKVLPFAQAKGPKSSVANHE